MGQCKKDITPVREQWSYVFLALTHPFSMMTRLHNKYQLLFILSQIENSDKVINTTMLDIWNYNMTEMILVGNEINFAIEVGLIRLHMPSGKKSCV